MERFNNVHSHDWYEEMDDLDRKLILLLNANPRMSVREMAGEVGLSAQAVHHRIQLLRSRGVIKGATATISIHYLGAVPFVVFGGSNTVSVERTLERLGESEFSNLALVAGGNYLYVIGALRSTSELDGYVEFVKRVAEMPSPTVGLFSQDYPEYKLTGADRKRTKDFTRLSDMDLRIIASLRDDARRPLAEVAEMVGVSKKTAGRHLDRMMSEGSIEFYVPWDASLGEDVHALVHLNLRDGAGKVAVGKRLLSKYPQQMMYIRAFSNLPDFLLCIMCWNKMTEVRRTVSEMGQDEDVKAVKFNSIYLHQLYPTWRDRMLGSYMPGG